MKSIRKKRRSRFRWNFWTCFFLFGFDDQKISFMLKRLVCISNPLIIHHNGLSFGGAWGRSKYRWPKCEHLYKSRSNWNHACLFGIIFPRKGFHWTDWTGPDAEAMRVIFDLKGRDGATIFINLPPCWIPCCVARNGEEMLTFVKVWGWKSCSVYFRSIPLFMKIPCEQHF